MTIATVEQIKHTIKNGSSDERYYVSSFLGRELNGVTNKQIQAAIDDVKAGIDNYSMWKGARPWHIVDVTASLPADQCWIGIEYETGFSTKKEYAKATQYFWDSYNNTTVDREGCGNFAAEFTFPPVAMSSFTEDSYFMDDFVGWLNKSKLYQSREEDDGDDYYDEDDVMVGIHCNISTPAMRAAGGSYMYEAVELVNSALGDFNYTQYDAIFGRDPYDMFFDHSENGKVWVEGKLFDSTDDIRVWKQYKERIVRFAELFEHIFSIFNDSGDTIDYLDSDALYEFLLGDGTVEKVVCFLEDDDEE